MKCFCSLRKSYIILFVFAFCLFLVACGTSENNKSSNVDPLVPNAISLKVKVAKVQIHNEVKLTYTITPATAQGDNVTVVVNNDLASVVIQGNNTIILTAGGKTGNVKVTVTTSSKRVRLLKFKKMKY